MSALAHVPERHSVGLQPPSRPRPVDPHHDVLRLLAILRRKRYVTRADCTWAMGRAKTVGVSPAHVLLTWAKVNRLQLWDAQCELWGIDWVDVRALPPDPALPRAAGLENCLSHGFVPYRLDGDVLTVATSVRPTAAAAADALRLMVDAAPHARRVAWIGCSDLDIDHMLLTACREDVIWDAADRFTAQAPDQTAATGPAHWNYPAFVVIVALLLATTIVRPIATLATLTVALSIIFLFGTGFKAAAAMAGARALRKTEIDGLEALLFEAGALTTRHRPTRAPQRRVPDDELPFYTILVPAYREEAVIAKLIENVEALDYPPEKLDVIVLLEEDDAETLAAAKAARPPGYVRLFVTPHGTPKTKPRACNAGLRFARGEYLVIYDAEDRPDPAQLREVLSTFEVSDEHTVVVQCRLNYFNAASNLLTRFFALEYAAWFDYMLPGLDALGLPIPLGGTSNHFITSALRDLGGWDAHNVTEDADLGLRATVRGMRVAVADSTTWEEACSVWPAWIKQRTRWIKGYMVTALVHTRHPLVNARRLRLRGTLGLVLLIAGTPLTFLALPAAWILAGGLYFASTIAHVGGISPWALKLSMINLTLGYLSVIATSLLAMTRRRAWWLAPYALLNPFYWCLHSIAAWRAAWQLFFSPSVWEKTPHGLDSNHRPPDPVSST